jgi:sialate O-acetylesterase
MVAAMPRCFTGLGVTALLCCAVVSTAFAEVKLPAIFGDHMVLQADQVVPVWGEARVGEAISVEFGGQKILTKANKDGHWRVNLPARPASLEPLELKIEGDNELVVFTNVLVGEVWLASGQSNMEWPLAKADGGSEAIAGATNPHVRLFQVARPTELPETTLDVVGAWAPSAPKSASEFSAVGFFFAQRLSKELGRPIGVIHTSWGGTPIEAWTSKAGLSRSAEGRHRLAGLGSGGRPQTEAQKQAAREQYVKDVAAWERANRQEDPGNEGEAQGFAKPELPAAGWQTMQMPGHWEDAGLDGDGVVWFRKELKVPAAWVGKELNLNLGVINDCDTTYVNGVKLAESCRGAPTTRGQPRTYVVPAALVKPGRMVVAVRVFDERGRGGFSSPAATLTIEPSEGGTAISLAGPWSYRVEKLFPTLNVRWDQEPKAPAGYPHPKNPHSLWDAMVAPLVPFAVRGVIWYQGEANVERAVQYRTLFPDMIRDWRKQWGQAEFAFYFVQLAGFRPAGDGREWAELREAQTMALKLPHTGMAVAIDIGDARDIHPTNKRDVGERLARWALGNTYGRPVVVSGPLFQQEKIEKNHVRLLFRYAFGLTPAPATAQLQGFTVAGADKTFFPALARVEGDTVVVSAPQVLKPVAVRYGWDGAPSCNLINAAGLPASPFRTDRWPEVTKDRH